MNNNIAKKNIAFLAVLFFLGIAPAQAADTLSIDRCRQQALLYNRQMQAATLAVEEAGHTVQSTRALMFPSLSAQAAALYSNGSLTAGVPGGLLPVGTVGVAGDFMPTGSVAWFPGLEMKMKVDAVYHAGLQLSQPLYMGGRLRAAYRMADLARDMRRLVLRKTEAEVIEDADRAYAQVVKATALRQVAGRYMELVEELERNVASAVDHGLRMRTDLLKVQVRRSEVELQLMRADNAIRLASMNLCHVMGLPLDTPVAVSMDYPVVDEALALQPTGVEARPEYGLLEAQTSLAGQQLKMARGEMAPQLALTAGYGYNRGLELNGRTLLHSWSFAGGVALSVPLYHFGERTHKVKAARLRLEQARLEQSDKCSLMQLELLQAANTLEEARMEVLVCEKSLGQAAENMQVCYKQYQAGTEPLSDYLEAQALWQQASEAVVDAGFQLYLGSVAYLKASGLLAQ